MTQHTITSKVRFVLSHTKSSKKESTQHPVKGRHPPTTEPNKLALPCLSCLLTVWHSSIQTSRDKTAELKSHLTQGYNELETIAVT